jgi:hypothetical protein
MTLKIGWCLCSEDAQIAFDPPARFIPPKDASGKGLGFLSCPAVRNYFDGIFFVSSPFSIRLRYTKEDGFISIKPVYPFTSISEAKFREFITVEPRETWSNSHTVALQIPSPYLFFSDTPATIEQFHPSLAQTSTMNWRVIPGKFDIYAWQRPLNWAIEWDTNLGDFVIRPGEPLYFIKFFDMQSGYEPVELVECEMTKEIKERLRLSRGITGIRKGLVPLMKKAGDARLNIKLITGGK